MPKNKPIGVFDSGLGGLTILAALLAAFPNEDFVYLGDTARVPYGSKSAETIVQYSLNNAHTLIEKAGIKALVVACNTASAVALDALKGNFKIPVLGVIESGAWAAINAATDGGIHVLATKGTVKSCSYPQFLKQLGYKGNVQQTACPLFVPLVEEGWTTGEISEKVAEYYLKDIPESSETVILGCTHYPLLKQTLEKCFPEKTFVGAEQKIVEKLAQILEEAQLFKADHKNAPLQIWVSDAKEQMHDLAPQFLGRELAIEQIDLIEVLRFHQ